MKFKFFEKFSLDAKKQEIKAETPKNKEANTLISKLVEFRNAVGGTLTEQMADDYVKNLIQLENFALSSNQANGIVQIHFEIMQKLKESGDFKEFTQGLATRGRIVSLGDAIDKIGAMNKQ